ncbi:MAG TPA: hypothetical protein VKP64_01210 [Mycobacteriales bacterium]|nr:hypothetical protein [Mycobacteriales bacterium]
MLRKLPLFSFVAFLVVVLYAVHLSLAVHACMTPQQVRADSRCLYIVNGKVYKQGTRAAPHFGNACGTDVTSRVPPSHTASPARYLAPNYVADVCRPGGP